MFLKSVKNTKCVVNMGSFKLKMHQNTFSAMAPPGPRWGSLQHPPRLPSWWEGAGCPLPKIPPSSRPFGPRFSAFGASVLCPSDLHVWPFGPQDLVPLALEPPSQMFGYTGLECKGV